MKKIKLFKFLFLLFFAIISISFNNNIYADYTFGGRLIYNKENNNGGYLYYYDIDSNINIRTNIKGKPIGSYKNVGEIYEKYNSSTGLNNIYYKAFNSLNEKQILPNNANFVKFNKQTGNYIYLENSNEQNYYINNINSTGSSVLFLSGTELGIDAISNDFYKIIYHKNDLTTGISVQYLKEIKTGNEIKLGVINENTGSLLINYKYNFIINSNKILKTTITYNNLSSITSTNYEYLNITDINNIIKTNANFNFGDNSKFIGAIGSNLFYEIDDISGVKHFYKKTGTTTTEILSGNYDFILDIQNNLILNYNNNIFYKYDDLNLGKKLVGYVNINDFSTGSLYSGDLSYDQIYLTTKTTKTLLDCKNIEICGQPVENYTDLQTFDDKQFSNELGFIGNKFTYTYTGIVYGNDASIGYLGNKFTYTYTGIIYGNDASIGYLGNKFSYTYTGNFVTASDSAIGFLGTKFNYVEPKLDYHIGNIGRYGSLPVVPQVVIYTNESPIGFLGMQNISNYLVSQDKLVYENTNTYLDNLKYNINRYLSNPSEILDDLGDPVNLYNGEFTYENTILKTKGNFPYSFDLYYSSQVQYSGIIGNNFDFSYNKFLSPDQDGNITYYNGKLGNYKFIKNADGNFDYNKDIKGYLELDDNGNYLLTLDNKTLLYFNSDLRISKIQDLNNNYLTFDYDFDGKLLKTTTSLGEVINYEYYQNNRLFKISGPNNYSVVFEYYSDGENDGMQYDLKSLIITNNGKITTNKFTYSKANNNVDAHNMLKLIDAGGQTYVENTYQNDRVITQKYGDGIISYNYLTDDNNKVIQNTVTNRNNTKTVYNYNSLGLTTKRSVILDENNSIDYKYEYDGSGNVLKEIYPKGNGYAYKYDENGNLIEKRFKKDVSVDFDEDSDLVYTYTYDPYFNIVNGITKPDGTKISYEYDDFGNLISGTTYNNYDIDGNTFDVSTNYTYSSNGNVISKTDEDGNITTFEYDDKNRIIKTNYGTGDEAITYNYVYDEKGNISQKIDPEGNVTYLTYNDYDLLKSVKSAEGIQTNFEYDALNNKIKDEIILEDNTKLSTTYKYDILDNPVEKKTKQDDTKSKIQISSYDGNGNIKQITDENNQKVSFLYDYNNKIVRKNIYSSAGDLLSYINYYYDLNGNLIKQVDSKNNSITYEYDLFDRLIKQINANKTYFLHDYDKVGNIINSKYFSSKDEMIQNTDFSYDKIGNNIGIVDHFLTDGIEKTSLKTEFKYSKSQKLVQTKLPDGKEILNTYDQFNRLIKNISKEGIITNFTYNKLNLVIKKEVINGNTTLEYAYSYDKDGRLIKTINPDNTTLEYAYNNLNQITSIINEKGVKTLNTYDYAGNIIKQEKYFNNDVKTTNYEYDTNNNLTKIIDSLNNATNYTYNEFDKITSITYPDNLKESYEYDNYQNLIKITKTDNTVINLTYDNLNRVIQKDISTSNDIKGVTSESYTYDELGRISKITNNENQVLKYTYDNYGKILSEKQNDYKIKYNYDNITGNLLSLTYPNGKIVSYGYDKNYLTNSVSINGENVLNNTFKDNQLITQSFKNNVITNYSYDSTQRLKSSITSVGNTVLKSYNYDYDKIGNITSDGYSNFTYDDLDRLVTLDNNSTKESFEYDKMGNIHNKTLTNSGITKTKSFEINNLNQYTKSKEINGTTNNDSTYIYDLNGNLKQDDKYKYFYDYKNNLIQTTDLNGNVIVSYKYDEIGRRYEKSTSLQKTTYIYAGENVIEENTTNISNQETIKKTYYYLLDSSDNVFRMDLENNNTLKSYYYTKNYQNSTVLLTDENGNVVEKYLYDAYGKTYIKKYDLNNSNSGSIIESGSLNNSGSTESNTGNIENSGSVETSSGNEISNSNTGIIETQTSGSGEGVLLNSESDIVENIDPIIATNPETSTTQTETNLTQDTTNNSGSDTLTSETGTIETSSGTLENNTNSGSITLESQSGSIESSSGIIDNAENIQNSSNGTLEANTGSNVGSGETTSSGNTETTIGNQPNSGILENNSSSGDIDNSTQKIIFDGEIYQVYDENTDSLNNKLFTGREFDKEINKYYYRARYYDTESGRFISRDPIGINDDVNLYNYVSNNPINSIDPSGEAAKGIIKGATEGDYNKNANGWETVGQIGAGFIPYYGQVADIRDFSYQRKNGAKLDIAMAGIAFIPGFGDGAKAAEKSLKKFDVTTYDINKIYKTQPYLNQKNIENIMESIKNEGFNIKNRIPVYIDNGKALIIDGHHRFEALKKLGYERIPVQFIQKERIHLVEGMGRTLQELRNLMHK